MKLNKRREKFTLTYKDFINMLEEILNTTDLLVDVRFAVTKNGRKFIGPVPKDAQFATKIGRSPVPPAKAALPYPQVFDIVPHGAEFEQYLELGTGKALMSDDLELIFFKYRLKGITHEADKTETEEREL